MRRRPRKVAVGMLLPYAKYHPEGVVIVDSSTSAGTVDLVLLPGKPLSPTHASPMLALCDRQKLS